MEADPTILRVTADDLGLARSINDGIFKAHDRGVVTHCSILAAGPAFDHAVAGLRARPSLATGLHLSLSDLPPLAGDFGASRFFRDGRFPSAWHVAAAIATGDLKAAEVAREVSAQAERCAAAGIALSHLDGHQHVHVLPIVAPAAVRCCRARGIRRIRVPIESSAPPPPPLGPIAASARTAAVTLASAPLGVLILWGGLSTTGAFHGTWCSGLGTVGRFRHALAHLRPGLNELMCHPGRDPGGAADAPAYRLAWEDELSALTSPEIAGTIKTLGVRLDRA